MGDSDDTVTPLDDTPTSSLPVQNSRLRSMAKFLLSGSMLVTIPLAGWNLLILIIVILSAPRVRAYESPLQPFELWRAYILLGSPILIAVVSHALAWRAFLRYRKYSIAVLLALFVPLLYVLFYLVILPMIGGALPRFPPA